jgi:cytochrome c biogenesis protein CcmG, thiol:disulfide interchange protein DsbE
MKLRDVLVLAGIASLVALLGFGLARNPDSIPSPLVGEPAPSFDLAELDGGALVSLDGLSGRPVIVNFWASWCLACIQEHPVLVRAWRKYEGRVEMVGIVYQDTPANARKYLEQYGGSWIQLLDPGTRTAIDYGVYGIPETFFIDREGRITHKHIGPVTDQLMTSEIEALLLESGPDEESAAELIAPGEEGGR